MRKLMFTVNGQHLRKSGDFSGIISGSRGYLKCGLQLNDNDWLRAKKVMVFNDEYAVLLNGNWECSVPDEVTDGRSFKVQLIGQAGKTRMTTNPVLVEQIKYNDN
nr:MAG TPA: hypothetical protein [Caudoviricetes sp.]